MPFVGGYASLYLPLFLLSHILVRRKVAGSFSPWSKIQTLAARYDFEKIDGAKRRPPVVNDTFGELYLGAMATDLPDSCCI